MDATQVAGPEPFRDLMPAQQSMLARLLDEVRVPAVGASSASPRSEPPASTET